jgi:hypothetical protein
MAWVDDRIWCHPKFTALTPSAFTVYIKGLAYSGGMATKGRLDREVQRMLGATAAIKNELVGARLWDLNGDGVSVEIHDWAEHNGKRDERRAADRERKRREREARKSAGQDAD